MNQPGDDSEDERDTILEDPEDELTGKSDSSDQEYYEDEGQDISEVEEELTDVLEEAEDPLNHDPMYSDPLDPGSHSSTNAQRADEFERIFRNQEASPPSWGPFKNQDFFFWWLLTVLFNISPQCLKIIFRYLKSGRFNASQTPMDPAELRACKARLRNKKVGGRKVKKKKFCSFPAAISAANSAAILPAIISLLRPITSRWSCLTLVSMDYMSRM